MVRIHALLDDLHAGSQLRLVLRAPAGKPNGPQLQFLENWEDLRDEITRESVDVAVVDPWVGSPRSSVAGRLGFLGRHLGYRRVVLYLSRGRAESTNLREVRRAGFSFILISGLDDDPGSLRQALGNATAQVFIEGVLARLDGRLEAGSASFLGKALAAALRAERVDDLAKALQTNSPKLRGRTQALGLPCPRELLRWGRLIRAFGFQSIGVESVGRLAYHTGYADPGSLCRLFRELLGHTPGNVPCSDVMSLMADGILRQAG